MSAIWYIKSVILPAAFKMLPARMDTPNARAMLLAIGLQESQFRYRRQIRGPALSFWQAESGGGFRGIVTHPDTASYARDILKVMGYGEPDAGDFQAVEDNDILAACGARLLLWTDPQPCPAETNPKAGWEMYMRTWRPGKPHPETWNYYWDQAWRQIETN